MFIFVTHNQALMWSRLERLCAVMVGVGVIHFFEGMGSQPTWLITMITMFVAQFIALKCWADMIIMSEPYKNCWAFEEVKS